MSDTSDTTDTASDAAAPGRAPANDLTALAYELQAEYREKRRMRRLFKDVVRALGRERTLELRAEVARIEAAGGLLIEPGTRRRTPGGVFLHLTHKALSDHPELFPAPLPRPTKKIILRYGAEWPGMTETTYRQLIAARIDERVIGLYADLARVAWDILGLAAFLEASAAIAGKDGFGRAWLSEIYRRLPDEARAGIAPPSWDQKAVREAARRAKKIK